MNGKGGGSPCRRVRDSFFLYIVFVINALELRIFFVILTFLRPR